MDSKINNKTDKMPISRVILMSCGKYNPPTHMHLRMFERARDHLHTLQTHTVVAGVISPNNDYHKFPDLASSAVRCDLLKIILENSEWVRLSTWEVRQNTYKSLRETLQHHQNILNCITSNDVDNNINNEDTEWIPDNIKNNVTQSAIKIKLLCGTDLLESFSTPGQWSEDDVAEIVGQYGLVVIGKEGSNHNKCIYDSDILSRYIHNIHVVTEWIPNEVNSTRIRRALRRGESVKYLLQNEVIDLIYKKEIYSAKTLSLSDTRTMMGERTTSTTTTSASTGSRVILMSCGSYNPPTHMHLRMFERARDHLHNLGSHVVVGGVISPVSDGYGKKDLASGRHRLEMLRLALRDSDWIRLSTWEIRQSSWTRTRQCLQRHQGILDALVLARDDDANRNVDNEDLDWIPEAVRNADDDATPVQIKLLCGGDLLESFATPGLWAEEDITEIVSRYGLIVITREGSHPYKFIYDSDVLSKHLHNIQIVTEWIPNEVSSTRIRRALKRGESVKYLLQDAVIDYVYENGIYGANRPSTIKLNLSSNHSSTDYLDADESKYQSENNALLTPSPSDVTMLEASPCEGSRSGPAEASGASLPPSEPLPESVLQKNLQNSARAAAVERPGSPEASELAREKFFRSIVNDSLALTADSSSSSLPAGAYGPPDSPLEPLGGSARARNELLAFEDATESELATLCDATFSEDREDLLSAAYDESSDELNEASFLRNGHEEALEPSQPEAGSPGTQPDYSTSGDNVDDTDSQATKFEAGSEIDGKYIKSLVNSKKSPKRLDDEESSKSDEEGHEKQLLAGLDVDATAKAEQHPEAVEPKKELKFEDDLSYIKKLRLVINKPTNGPPSEQQQQHRQQLQGSLDSINLRESGRVTSEARAAIEPISKKSKSFESIKRSTLPGLRSGPAAEAQRSDSGLRLSSGPEPQEPLTDEFCSACCFASGAEQPSSSAFFSLRSNYSSPEEEEEEDSTECDICSSCNLRDSSERLSCRGARAPEPQDAEEAELCEICGEPAAEGARPLSSLPKAKSTIEISRASAAYRAAYRAALGEEAEYGPEEACGLRDCRLRGSLDVCNRPEPLYVNVGPRYQLPPLAARRRPQAPAEQPGPEQREELAMARSLSLGGKRLSRRGSYAKKPAAERGQEKRRFSSADNLQNRASFRSGPDKFSRTRDNKFMTSADNIRPARVLRSRSLRRSADNVGRFDSSGDNLDSLEEAADTDDNNEAPEQPGQPRCARVKIRDSDTIKMILTKHGIKIISQKETVL